MTFYRNYFSVSFIGNVFSISNKIFFRLIGSDSITLP